MSADQTEVPDVFDLLSHLIHREILRLALLTGVAFAAFLLTRAIAQSNHANTLHEAAEWYRRGEQQASRHNVDAAVDAFRRARLRDRDNRIYALAYARALEMRDDTAAAQNALLALRQSAPEDPEINTELARLARKRGNVSDAVHYYQYALYAPWPSNQESERRELRLEMIKYLLQEKQNTRAVAELIPLSNDAPDNPASHIQLGELFAEAGDAARSINQYNQALRRDPHNATAWSGMARGAYALGDYPRTRRYLRQISSLDAEQKQMLAIVTVIASSDPTAARISNAERVRRLRDNIDFVADRLYTCTQSLSDAQRQTTSLTSEAEAYKRRLNTESVQDEARLDQGLDLIYRMEQLYSATCAPVTNRDRALMLISERHRAEDA